MTSARFALKLPSSPSIDRPRHMLFRVRFRLGLFVDPHDIWPFGQDSCVLPCGQDSCVLRLIVGVLEPQAPLAIGALSGRVGVPRRRDCSCRPVFRPASVPSGRWGPSSWDASIRTLIEATPRSRMFRAALASVLSVGGRPGTGRALGFRGSSTACSRRRCSAGWCRAPVRVRSECSGLPRSVVSQVIVRGPFGPGFCGGTAVAITSSSHS